MNESESGKRLPSLDKLIKYTLITLGIVFSAIILLSTKMFVSSLAFLAITWVLGVYLYKRRSMILGNDNDSQIPLKDYILAKKQEKEALDATLPSSKNYVPLDALDSDSLTQSEIEKWANITSDFHVEPEFDRINLKSRRKKRKKE